MSGSTKIGFCHMIDIKNLKNISSTVTEVNDYWIGLSQPMGRYSFFLNSIKSLYLPETSSKCRCKSLRHHTLQYFYISTSVWPLWHFLLLFVQHFKVPYTQVTILFIRHKSMFVRWQKVNTMSLKMALCKKTPETW